MQKVLIFDTSILCVWLQVPGKETCGSTDDRWEKERVDDVIAREVQAQTILVLPLATIIETGNHISQAASQRYEKAQALARIMEDAADEKTPWAAFTQQSDLWSAKGLKQLATELPNLAMQKISIGDATIKTVAEYYSRRGSIVEILTGDKGLKAYEPITLPQRRRSSRT